MKSGSLRLRLILSSAIAISLALAVAGAIFYAQFQKHVERLALNDFDAYFQQLASGFTFDEEGRLEVENELTDPRFSRQYGGMYWQVDQDDGTQLRSRSLWDTTLDLPTPPAKKDADHVHILNGPDGAELFAVQRRIQIEKPSGQPISTIVTIAVDRRNISNAISAFSSDIIKGFSLLYVMLMLSALGQILLGLSPLAAIKDAIANIRDGSQRRMVGEFPTELNPLVGEINNLMESRDIQLDRARQRAGNLAHGLKTPLTVMDAIANDLKPTNIRKASKEITNTTRDMRNLIERELMRARMSTQNANNAVVLHPIVERIVGTFKKTGRDNPKVWSMNIAKDASVSIDADDLTEILGNLLDNARLHAKSRIHTSFLDGTLAVEDDGAGVPDAKLAEIFKRGLRLDEKKPGSGLGLAIVQDIADAYGADISASRSSLGGLKISISPQRT
jgi:signal transduction histidine kinase